MRHTGAVTLFSCAIALAVAVVPVSHVVPGKVFPNVTQTYDMHKSTIAMMCNSTGPIDPKIGSKWGLVDIDWSGGMPVWSKETVRTIIT